MASDLNKPDLSDDLLECPLTRWDFKGINLDEARTTAAALPHCPAEIKATTDDNGKGLAYFKENRDEIRARLRDHGAVWLRGFDLTKGVAGEHDRGASNMHNAT